MLIAFIAPGGPEEIHHRSLIRKLRDRTAFDLMVFNLTIDLIGKSCEEEKESRAEVLLVPKEIEEPLFSIDVVKKNFLPKQRHKDFKNLRTTRSRGFREKGRRVLRILKR